MIGNKVILMGMAGVFASCSAGSRGPLINQERQNSIRECLGREAEAVAPKKVDLETAVMAVMARCSGEIDAADREMLNKYPGYRDVVMPGVRELNEIRLDYVRKTIALARTR